MEDTWAISTPAALDSGPNACTCAVNYMSSMAYLHSWDISGGANKLIAAPHFVELVSELERHRGGSKKYTNMRSVTSFCQGYIMCP